MPTGAWNLSGMWALTGRPALSCASCLRSNGPAASAGLLPGPRQAPVHMASPGAEPCVSESPPEEGAPQDSRSGPALGQHPKPGLARLRPPPTTPGSLGSIGPTMEHFFPCQGFSLLFVGAQASSPSQAHPETLLSPPFLPHTPQGQPLFPMWDTYGAKRTEVKSPMAHPPFKTTGLGIPPLPAVPGPGGPSSPGSSSTAWMSGTCGHAPPPISLGLLPAWTLAGQGRTADP